MSCEELISEEKECSLLPIAPGTHVMVTVVPGDSLYAIANRYGSSVEAIVEANALRPPITESDLIYPGQQILVRIPGMSQASTLLHQVAAGDTLYYIAERYSSSVDLLAALNQLQRPDILSVAQLISIPAFIYEVEQGDSLFRIARRFGLSLNELIRANRNRPALSGDLIYAGFRLVIPLPSSTNILVVTPFPGSRIRTGQLLSGYARAFEANVLYQIQDANGQVITAEQVMTASIGAPSYGFFSTPITIQRSPTTPSGTILVYTRSARDGSIQDLVQVPVIF